VAAGTPAPLGTERVAKNGYRYIKTETGWRLYHHVVFEEAAGRAIDNEMIRFKDGDITNFDPDNLIAVPKGTSRARAKVAQLDARIEDLQAERAYYAKQLAR
jgi:hypothetical protein